MTSKLTLTMDKSIIEQAKEYAYSKDKSVSMLVSEYLQRISDEDRGFDTSKLHSPITDSLAGFIPDDGRDYKELLDEARMERFKQKGFDIP
jgi:hypothetical protein